LTTAKSTIGDVTAFVDGRATLSFMSLHTSVVMRLRSVWKAVAAGCMLDGPEAEMCWL
jgi:hypothetical protein